MSCPLVRRLVCRKRIEGDLCENWTRLGVLEAGMLLTVRQEHPYHDGGDRASNVEASSREEPLRPLCVGRLSEQRWRTPGWWFPFSPLNITVSQETLYKRYKKLNHDGKMDLIDTNKRFIQPLYPVGSMVSIPSNIGPYEYNYDERNVSISSAAFDYGGKEGTTYIVRCFEKILQRPFAEHELSPSTLLTTKRRRESTTGKPCESESDCL